MAELVYPPVIRTALLAFRLMDLKIEVRNAERIPPTGGAVVAVNHVGYPDFVFAGLAAWKGRHRLVRFMAKEEVFAHRIAGPLMRAMHHIPVDRTAGADSYRAAVDALRAGELVGVFPEATISRSFLVKDLKTGAARMAAEAGVPLIPVIVWGTHRVMSKGHGRNLGRSHLPVTVSVGEALHPAAGDDPLRTTEVLRQRMSVLLDDAQRSYPDVPKDEADRWWLPASLGGTAPTLEEADEMDAEAKAAREARRAARRARAEGDIADPAEGATPPAA